MIYSPLSRRRKGLNMERDIILAAAKSISPRNAQRYLAAKGWSLLKTDTRDDILVFNHRKYRLKQIVVPKFTDYEKFPEDMAEVLLRLEEIEERGLSSIITQLSDPNSDILRYRIKSRQAESGTLSLSVIQRFISSIIGTLRASVCDNITRQLYHQRMGFKQVKRLLDRAQFGQTEHGSFVVKVVAPLDNLCESGPQFTEMLDDGTRQGIVHLLVSVEKIVNVIESGSIRNFVRKGLKEPPFSSNLAHSLVDMQVWEDADIEISSEWAPVLKVDKKTPSKAAIPSEYFKEIEMIGDAFAPKETAHRVEYFSGVISDLNGDLNENGKRFGEVIVQALSAEGESFAAKLFLTEHQYEIADKSHMENSPIFFSGKLVRKGSRGREIKEIGLFSLCAEVKEQEAP